MADLEAIATAIRTRVKAQVTDGLSIPTQFDNFQPITKPDNSAWLACEILPSESRRITLGTNRVRHQGIVYLRLFVPVLRGENDAWSKADSIKALFNGITVSGVTYRTPTIARVGRDTDGKWWQLNIRCPYYSDETN